MSRRASFDRGGRHWFGGIHMTVYVPIATAVSRPEFHSRMRTGKAKNGAFHLRRRVRQPSIFQKRLRGQCLSYRPFLVVPPGRFLRLAAEVPHGVDGARHAGEVFAARGVFDPVAEGDNHCAGRLSVAADCWSRARRLLQQAAGSLFVHPSSAHGNQRLRAVARTAIPPRLESRGFSWRPG